jgi:pimeloyl-ACP methyl ester carboxylesterase
MSVGVLKTAIIISCLLILPPVWGKQEPVETPIQGKAVSKDGVEIVYMTQGKGDTAVVFIHGGFADKGYWVNQVKPVSEKYRFIALDLAGHGESGKNRKNWDLVSFGEDVRAVVDKENVKWVILVGNSLGGPVALEAARLLGDKVKGIVAVDTFHDLAERPPADYYKKIGQSYRTDFAGTMGQMVRALFHTDADPVLYARVEKQMMNHSPEMAAAMMESFEGYDFVGIAKQVKVPIRCINGDLYPTAVEKNRVIHPDFNAVILPHTGHYPMLEKPELFNRHLMEILLHF